MIEALVWFGVFILVNFIGIVPPFLIVMFTDNEFEDVAFTWHIVLTLVIAVFLAYLSVNNMQFLASL